jgi:HEAT repeat protein
MNDLSARLDELFSAERSVRRLHDDLAKQPVEALLGALEAAVKTAQKSSDPAEVSLRLVRIGELLGEVGGPRAIDLLLDLMGASEPEARVVAGEALEELAYSRFKEVALGVERALGRLPKDSPALCEIPYMLAEIPEGGTVVLLRKFLALAEPEPVAAAVEALVEVGDPEAIPALRALANDKRTVSMESMTEEGSLTIGELAAEAVALLEQVKGR